jgi:hypothetical protein
MTSEEAYDEALRRIREEEVLIKKQAPDDSHHRVLVLSNRSLNQSTILCVYT